MRRRASVAAPYPCLASFGALLFSACAMGCSSNGSADPKDPPADDSGAIADASADASADAADGACAAGDIADTNGARAIAEGRQTFRFETFGDEAFWTGSLKLNQAIAGSSLGGVGSGLSPKAALALGLKVDADAIPAALATQIKAGQVNLDDPATTLALLQLNAVVGVKGTVSPDGKTLMSLGIECAFCHSTVDDSFAPGIGKRLDGWPNRDLNVGAIVSLSPDLSAFTTLLGVDDASVRQVLAAWGPGKFDAELILDGKGFTPSNTTSAVLIPPAYGLAGVNLHTYTGWGSVPYWNAFVAILEMHGSGNFFDPRLDDAAQFPVAARAHLGHVTTTTDLVAPKLADLQFYQLSLPAPKPAAGSFDEQAAARGKDLFDGAAKCSTCHVPPLFTDSGWNLHTPAEIGIDDFAASRSPTKQYRTTPLRGLVSHAKGGYYHDGRFATLLDVVNHYNTVLALNLTDAQKNDLVEYLKSL